MDVPHLVLAVARRLRNSAAVHFLLIGFFAFLVTGGWDVVPEWDEQGVVIPIRRVQLVHEQLAMEKGRLLSEKEKEEATNIIINREVLYLYSREIGLESDPVVQQRLGLIAKFVAEFPHEQVSEERLAREAVELGLIDGDPVSRRILIDGARRLIRGTALVREPNEEGLAQYLIENPDDFQIPGRTRITHVALNQNRHGEGTEAAARRMMVRLVEEGVSPEEAIELGDSTVVSPELPAITDQALERRFGSAFVAALTELPEGTWQGPIKSQLGYHVVFIHERMPQRVATLEEARDAVSAQIRNLVADRVLAARLLELRAHFGVRIEEPAT